MMVTGKVCVSTRIAYRSISKWPRAVQALHLAVLPTTQKHSIRCFAEAATAPSTPVHATAPTDKPVVPGVFDGSALQKVKNLRDAATVNDSRIKPGRLYRTGFLSDATPEDVELLTKKAQLRTLIDLRSPTELKMDKNLHAAVYEPFSSKDITPLGSAWGLEREGKGPVNTADGDSPALALHLRHRYFISLMNERKYVLGVFWRLQGLQKFQILALFASALVSRRAYAKARSIFLSRINAGGLLLLNEMLLQYGGAEMARAMKLIADPANHPVAFYCTAGKDRTGIIMALILSAIDVPADAILDDYTISDDAYKQLGDKDAMVGALRQQDLDSDTFLCAPRHIMADTLQLIQTKYGSTEAYLDGVGFDASWRAKLKQALTQ